MTGLGFWQLDRAEQKRALFTAFESDTAYVEPDDLETMPDSFAGIRVKGRFISEFQVIADGISQNEQPGYYVLSAFQPLGSDKLLMINRGWQAWGNQLRQVAEEAIAIDASMRLVAGRAVAFPQAGMVLGDGNSSERNTWPRLAVYPQAAEIANWIDAPVLEWELLLDENQADGFSRDWTPATMRPERHLGYAFQWFAMALTTVILWVIISFPKVRETSNNIN